MIPVGPESTPQKKVTEIWGSHTFDKKKQQHQNA